MKKIKLFTTLFLALTVCFNFSSCSDDDDNETVNDQIEKKQNQISKIRFEDSSNFEEYNFNYNDNKITSFNVTRNESLLTKENHNIRYFGNEIIYDATTNLTEKFNAVLPLNNMGYASSASIESDGQYGKFPYEFVFSYDNDGHLFEFSEKNNDQEYKYKWGNNNLTELDWSLFDLTYGTMENKYNIDINSILMSNYAGGCVLSKYIEIYYFSIMNFIGKPSKNLITRIDCNYDSKTTYSFEYNFNEVKKILSINVNRYDHNVDSEVLEGTWYIYIK